MYLYWFGNGTDENGPRTSSSYVTNNGVVEPQLSRRSLPSSCIKRRPWPGRQQLFDRDTKIPHAGGDELAVGQRGFDREVAHGRESALRRIHFCGNCYSFHNSFSGQFWSRMTLDVSSRHACCFTETRAFHRPNDFSVSWDCRTYIYTHLIFGSRGIDIRFKLSEIHLCFSSLRPSRIRIKR